MCGLTQQQQQCSSQCRQVRKPQLQRQQVNQRDTERPTESWQQPQTPHTHTAGVLCVTKQTHKQVPSLKQKLSRSPSNRCRTGFCWYLLQFCSTESSHQSRQGTLEQEEEDGTRCRTQTQLWYHKQLSLYQPPRARIM